MNDVQKMSNFEMTGEHN